MGLPVTCRPRQLPNRLHNCGVWEAIRRIKVEQACEQSPLAFCWGLAVFLPEPNEGLWKSQCFSQLTLVQTLLEALNLDVVAQRVYGCRDGFLGLTVRRNVTARCVYSALCKTQQCCQGL